MLAEADAVGQEMDGLFGSFCPTGGIVEWDVFGGIKPQDTKMFGLKVEAMAATMLGNGEPNWAMIEGIFGIPIGERTLAQQMAMTMVLNQVDDKHLTRFFLLIMVSAGATDLLIPNEETSLLHSDEFFREHMAQINGFDLNMAEIAWLQDGNAMLALNMLAQASVVEMATPGDTNNPFYAAIRARMLKEGISFEYARAEMLDDLRGETGRVFQTGTLLDNLATLSFPGGDPFFIGLPGSNNPEFSITREGNGLAINFARHQAVIMPSPLAPDLFTVGPNGEMLPNLEMQQIIIGNGAFGSFGVTDVAENLPFLANHNANARISEAMGRALLDEIISSLLGTATEGLPGIGFFTTGAAVLWAGHQERQQIQQEVEAAEGLRNTILDANFASQFRMYTVVVTQNGEQFVITMPSNQTQGQIDLLNVHVASRTREAERGGGDFDLNNYGLTYPICMNQLLNNAPDLQDFNNKYELVP